MSLRSFHIFFILLAAASCAGLCAWAVWRWQDGWEGGPWLALLAAAAAAGLVPYLVWFRRTYRAA